MLWGSQKYNYSISENGQPERMADQKEWPIRIGLSIISSDHTKKKDPVMDGTLVHVFHLGYNPLFVLEVASPHFDIMLFRLFNFYQI